MYRDEKQWRMWLMVIPFLVMHVLGSRSLFSMYGLFNFNSGSFYSEVSDCYQEISECIFSEFIDSGNLDKISFCEKQGISFLRDVFKGLKRQKKNLSAEEVFVCDNRIDKMSKKYSQYLCETNIDLSDNSFLSVV